MFHEAPYESLLGVEFMTKAFACVIVLLLALGNQASAAEPLPLTMKQLATLSDCELEQIYRASAAAAMPSGYLKGLPIYPQSKLSGVRSKTTSLLWHGKHFDAETGTLINQWCGIKAIKARVYPGESWLDGKPSLIMDYEGSSLVWNDVRDELREVAPGLYLGAMYLRRPSGPKFKMWFVLEGPCK